MNLLHPLTRFLQACVYAACYALSALVVGVFFPLRILGSSVVPRSGGVLVVSNHQSYLDPIIIGLALSRSASYVAKIELFRFPPLRWLLSALNAMQIDRKGMTKATLKESVDRLRGGGVVVIWPEGTRTSNGRLGPLHAGVLLLCRRAEVPVVVAGVAGSFESWPRSRLLPRPIPLFVQFGRWGYEPSTTSQANLDSLQRALEESIAAAVAQRGRFLAANRR